MRRSNSTGQLGESAQGSTEMCPKCDLGLQHRAHTYKGSCKGLPKEFYFLLKGGKKPTVSVPMHSSDDSFPSLMVTPKFFQPLAASLALNLEPAGRSEQITISTEPARRKE